MKKHNLLQNNLILIGMMGSGKSTIGQLLAEKLERDFLDTDQLVEELAKQTIAEIITTEGEDRFRRLESQVVLQIASQIDKVIATGGGVVLKPENISRLSKTGMIIFLKASPDVIYERLREDTKRPLLKVTNPLMRIEEIWNERLSLYQTAARLEIQTDMLKPEEVVAEILSELSLYRLSSNKGGKGCGAEIND